MIQSLFILFGLFLISLLLFIFVLTHERRSMWSGMMLVITLFNLGLFYADSMIVIESKVPGSRSWVLVVVVTTITVFFAAVLLFILTIIIMFIYNGIKILLKEGTHLTNFLSLAMGIAIVAFLLAFPLLSKMSTPPWLQFLYIFLVLTILYLTAMMMMYTLTSFINLVNWHTKKLDYIVVLGAGLMGKQVTPLLASRINRGIEIYKKNPGSKIIMSGGQGPGEDIPEGEAMARYALDEGIPKEDIIIENKSRTTNENIAFSRKLMTEDSRFCIVTNSYHVYRALILAKRQGVKCIGYGAKTKWYFTLNAFVREYIAYLVITKKLQSSIIGTLAGIMLLMTVVYYTMG